MEWVLVRGKHEVRIQESECFAGNPDADIDSGIDTETMRPFFLG
jgi:hypothetical protein